MCVAPALVGAQTSSASTEIDPFRPRVKVETTLGDFVLELDAHKAPLTVLNFVRYGEDGFYDGTIFHRVKNDFLIQGGGFLPDMSLKTEGLRSPIRNEWTNGLKNVKGTIAMARKLRKPHSARAQFFINVVDNPFLDRDLAGAAYCVFGKVVEGRETIEKIRNTPVGTHPRFRRGKAAVVPTEPVVIKSVKLISAFDRSKSEAAVEMLKRVRAEWRAEEAERREDFAKWFAEMKAKAVTTDSGLMYVDLAEGEGSSPALENKIRVNYTSWLPDGTILTDTREKSEPEEIWVERMIDGWVEGVLPMKVGGRRVLIIPPELGFGDQAMAKIPPNSTLVYDLELFAILE
jgi:cyclophilin family peptidyl-prolyl cis-trans isomerase